jgi:hypothetical protein
MRHLVLAALLVLPLSSFAAEGDGQGCMWMKNKGRCGVQLISPKGLPMTCDIKAVAVTKGGREITETRTTTLKPWEVAMVDVTAKDDIVKMTSSASCK